MNRILWRIFGVPFGTADRAAAFRQMTGTRSAESALEFFRDGAQHNTHKSGALLGAQGIFVVVDIFALDHGWPRAIVLASMVLLLAASLLVMGNLRGTLGAYRSASQVEAVQRVYELVLLRSVRFNIALYLSFLSIVLLICAALAFA